jgi:hypothetical protein
VVLALLGTLVGALLVTGCSSSPAAPREAGPAAPRVRLSFIQQRIDEGTSRANLRLISREGRQLTVSGIGLDWEGYGGSFRRVYETTVAARQTLDLRMQMPSPSCGPAPAPAYGIVVLDGVTVRARIDASGEGYLHRMWQRACDQRAVSKAVSIRYAGPWRSVRAFGWDGVQGRMEVVRRSGSQAVTLTELTGSVLFDLHAEPVVLPPGAASASSPVVFVPGRCDAHGLSQSQQTFVFRATVRLDAGRRMRVYAEPDDATRRVANGMLRKACG